MTEQCTRRETKRHQTALRLQQCAVRLTLDKGFDGWTMDDLAVEADVSRRTVFNYFDAKADVVLGPMPELSADRLAVFVDGGPTANLLDDVMVLASDIVAEQASDQEAIAAGRAAILGDSRLLAMVHERFEELSATFVEHVRAREGADFPTARARLIGRLVATFFDAALERFEADPDLPFADHLAGVVADARLIVT